LIPELRGRFNRGFRPEQYVSLLDLLEQRCGARVEFRVAETPIFVPLAMLEAMAAAGADLARLLIGNPAYLAAARQAIPAEYRVAGETAHPNFLTADFGLVRTAAGDLVPRLVEIQAFPSVYGYQEVLCSAYREAFGLPEGLGCFLGGPDGLDRPNKASYWDLLARTVLGDHDPENVVLTELDPLNQKTLPDFEVTARGLGIAIVDIRSLEAAGNKLHYRNASGGLVPIHRIYNRAIADELIAHRIRLPFDLTRAWDVEWAGHPNWYFLISKFSIPWLSNGGGLSRTECINADRPETKRPSGAKAKKLSGCCGTAEAVPFQNIARVSEADAAEAVPFQSPVYATSSGLAGGHAVVPPAVFLDDFLERDGRTKLEEAGVPLPPQPGRDKVYSELLLKPLFSFAGKGIQFDPTEAQLEAIPAGQRANFLLQQRMHFEPTVETPHGLTQAEIRILYLWPDAGSLTSVLSLVRLGRGKMMGVDHNKNQEWVGASAAFFPVERPSVSK
jgi:hypothetical protein